MQKHVIGKRERNYRSGQTKVNQSNSQATDLKLSKVRPRTLSTFNLWKASAGPFTT
jgi:hypothetical protein